MATLTLEDRATALLHDLAGPRAAFHADQLEAIRDLVADAEQVLVTAAVADDVPDGLKGHRFRVAGGEVVRD